MADLGICQVIVKNLPTIMFLETICLIIYTVLNLFLDVLSIALPQPNLNPTPNPHLPQPNLNLNLLVGGELLCLVSHLSSLVSRLSRLLSQVSHLLQEQLNTVYVDSTFT